VEVGSSAEEGSEADIHIVVAAGSTRRVNSTVFLSLGVRFFFTPGDSRTAAAEVSVGRSRHYREVVGTGQVDIVVVD
jgi:hypothetical protein